MNTRRIYEILITRGVWNFASHSPKVHGKMAGNLDRPQGWLVLIGRRIFRGFVLDGRHQKGPVVKAKGFIHFEGKVEASPSFIGRRLTKGQLLDARPPWCLLGAWRVPRPHPPPESPFWMRWG